MSELEVWSAITMRPRGITGEMLGQAPHVRQCRILARATSRVGFARALIAAGVESRSATAVSAWLRDYGSGPSRDERDLAAVTDDRVYATSLDRCGEYVPVPPR